MAKYMLIILWLIIVCVSMKRKRQLIILMIDGARWDYVEMMGNDHLHGFRYFKEKGIRVEYVETIFPTVSYPCWTTLSTGLYPENHGIIGNVMYDKEHDQDFALGQLNTKLPLWWQDAEPIWTTATRAGLKVVTIDWSMSDVPVRGVLPFFAKTFSDSWDINGKLQEAFTQIKNGVDLVMVHYSDVDMAGHNYGPNSEEVILYMMTVGKALETFINNLLNGGFMENVDIIIVSDHGMTLVCNYAEAISKTVNIKRETTKIVHDGPMVGIFSKPGSELYVYNKLKFVPDYIVNLRSEIPDRFHYKRSSRAPDILLYAKYKKEESCDLNIGDHGYDPAVPDMRPLFLAFGKSFNGEGLVHTPINLVDIYQIYCQILGIKPKPHNGSWENVKFLMASSQDDSQQLHDYLDERRAFTLRWDNYSNRGEFRKRYTSVTNKTANNSYCNLLYLFISLCFIFQLKLN